MSKGWLSTLLTDSLFESLLAVACSASVRTHGISSSIRTLVLCMLLLSIVHLPTAKAQRSALETFESQISSGFARVGKIVLPGTDSLLIGEISTLHIGKHGRFVITDMIGTQAILFESNGNVVSHLDARQCNPGVVFYPTGAKIKADSTVLVLGTSPWGFLFNQDGQCIHSLASDFEGLGQNELVVHGSDKMIGLYETGAGHVLRFMNGVGEMMRQVDLPSSPAPGIDYRWNGGGLVRTANNFYYATPSSLVIVQLDLEGRLTKEFTSNNSWLRPIKNDVPDPFNSRSVDRHMPRIVRNKSMVKSLVLLEHDLMMIQYRNGDRKFGLQVFDELGNVVEEFLGTDDYFDYALNGLAYRVVQPDPTSRGEYPNPHIEVYKYKGR